jgi:hypothetical protein
MAIVMCLKSGSYKDTAAFAVILIIIIIIIIDINLLIVHCVSPTFQANIADILTTKQ